jgi:hypothetical protein
MIGQIGTDNPTLCVQAWNNAIFTVRVLKACFNKFGSLLGRVMAK